MKRTLLVALVLLPLVTDVAAAQTGTPFLVCTARNRDNTAGYLSGVIDLKGATPPEVESAWKLMSIDKYGAMGSSSGCQRFTTAAGAEARRKTLLEGMKDDGLRTTESTWTYTAPSKSADSAPAAPAAPDSAATKALAAAKGWCEMNMHELRDLFGCDCFAKMIARWRQAHPNELVKDPVYPQGKPPSIPQIVSGFRKTRLECSECLTDEHIAAYVQDMVVLRYANGQTVRQYTPAVEACATKRFAETLRAEPYLDFVRAAWNQSLAVCTGSKP